MVLLNCVVVKLCRLSSRYLEQSIANSDMPPPFYFKRFTRCANHDVNPLAADQTQCAHQRQRPVMIMIHDP